MGPDEPNAINKLVSFYGILRVRPWRLRTCLSTSECWISTLWLTPNYPEWRDTFCRRTAAWFEPWHLEQSFNVTIRFDIDHTSWQTILEFWWTLALLQMGHQPHGPVLIGARWCRDFSRLRWSSRVFWRRWSSKETWPIPRRAMLMAVDLADPGMERVEIQGGIT
jgi:hypothetical protein